MWEQIHSNQRRSVFVVSALGVVLVAIGMAIGALLVPDQSGMFFGGLAALVLWLILWLVNLSQGDDIMMRIARARQIEKQHHPTLFNVVEEMAIASRLGKMPRVYIVDDPAPNAFATGRDPNKAAVAVTTGLLELLDRDELQGVVAHELGHIKNRDVALMTTAGVMIGAIVLLAEIGMRALWFGGGMRRSRSSGRDGGGQAIVMVVAIVVMILAPILAQLIYFALSRRREYLADASGALFTRYPEGLASALEKLGGARVPQADKSRVTKPMYIVRPLDDGEQRSLNAAFATHPPLADRIKILRGMAGGASLKDYDAAYREVKHSRVVGARSLAAAEEVPIQRPAAAAAGPVSPRARARAASDAFLGASGYERRVCGNCQATLKIPPGMSDRVERCPRCGATL